MATTPRAVSRVWRVISSRSKGRKNIYHATIPHSLVIMEFEWCIIYNADQICQQLYLHKLNIKENET